MLRVLFIALAVVALGLAIVLQIGWLYFVAAGLLVSAAVVLGIDLRQRHRRSRPEPVTMPVAPVDDLKAFGIMEIRPKGTARTTAVEAQEAVGNSADRMVQTVKDAAHDATDDEGPGTVGDGAPSFSGHETTPTTRRSQDSPRTADGSRSTPGSGQGPLFESVTRGTPPEGSTGTVRKRARSARIMVEGVSDVYPAEVLLSTLKALRAAVDATTVCLLAQETSPLRYRVEAIVSRNAFARHGGAFNASEPLVAGARALDPVVHEMGSGHPFSAQRLGYYHERIAVHQVAIVPLTDDSGNGFYLVADTMEHHGLETETSIRMLSDFGRLIASFVDSAQSTGHTETIGLRPRREIIEEEMGRARTMDKPLALALVHLNGPDHEAADLNDARNQAMESLLRSTGEEDRVERFGDLTFGIFKSAEADAMEDWASRMQIRFARQEHPLDGGVSIGVAVLGDRHDGPDELRSDATRALRESFETGYCVVSA